jgi:hypothetical protein
MLSSKYAQRGNQENPSYIDPADDTVELRETLAQAIGELHGPEQESASQGFIVLPNRVLCIDQEVLVMPKHIRKHHADKRKKKILRAQPWSAAQWY